MTATRARTPAGWVLTPPAPLVDDKLHQRIMEEIIEPTLNGLAADGMTYTGFLYAGLMVSPHGEVNVLEFNCRCGDPETQPHHDAVARRFGLPL